MEPVMTKGLFLALPVRLEHRITPVIPTLLISLIGSVMSVLEWSFLHAYFGMKPRIVGRQAVAH